MQTLQYQTDEGQENSKDFVLEPDNKLNYVWRLLQFLFVSSVRIETLRQWDLANSTKLKYNKNDNL